MPRFPAADWVPADRNPLQFTGGPPKIVWHTTEGSTTEGAIATFRRTGYWPHFTVGPEGVAQHIDTSTAAFALRNASGGAQTNTSCCWQIEVVGFAGRPKTLRTLGHASRLAQWLTEVHGVEPTWPSGYPKVAVDGRDPGGHNRSTLNWLGRSGHYGHCHVPENFHWDPAFTAGEVMLITPQPDPQPEPEEEYDMGIIAHDGRTNWYIEAGTRIALDPDSLAALRAVGVKDAGLAIGLVERAKVVVP